MMRVSSPFMPAAPGRSWPGPSDGRPFFYVCPQQSLSEAGQGNLDRFLAAARVEITGPLELAESPRESGATYDPLWKQMSHLVYEKNWEEFDGFTPTFDHPSLTTRELNFLLGAAYARFYVRPTFLANLLGIQSATIRQVLRKLDTRVFAHQSQREIEAASRAVSC